MIKRKGNSSVFEKHTYYLTAKTKHFEKVSRAPPPNLVIGDFVD